MKYSSRTINESRHLNKHISRAINESEMNDETESALMIINNDDRLYNFSRAIAEEENFSAPDVAGVLEENFEEQLNNILEDKGVELLFKQLTRDAMSKIDWIAIAKDICEEYLSAFYKKSNHK